MTHLVEASLLRPCCRCTKPDYDNVEENLAATEQSLLRSHLFRAPLSQVSSLSSFQLTLLVTAGGVYAGSRLQLPLHWKMVDVFGRADMRAVTPKKGGC